MGRFYSRDFTDTAVQSSPALEVILAQEKCIVEGMYCHIIDNAEHISVQFGWVYSIAVIAGTAQCT